MAAQAPQTSNFLNTVAETPRNAVLFPCCSSSTALSLSFYASLMFYLCLRKNPLFSKEKIFKVCADEIPSYTLTRSQSKGSVKRRCTFRLLVVRILPVRGKTPFLTFFCLRAYVLLYFTLGQITDRKRDGPDASSNKYLAPKKLQTITVSSL